MAVVVAMAFTACGLGVRTRALVGEKVRVQVQVARQANLNNPVAVDVLLVFDEALLKELQKMPAREWFDKREQIKRDFPDTRGFEVWEHEWVPGQDVAELVLPYRVATKGAVIFANYLTPGDHRGRWDGRENITLGLQEKGFTVIPR